MTKDVHRALITAAVAALALSACGESNAPPLDTDAAARSDGGAPLDGATLADSGPELDGSLAPVDAATTPLDAGLDLPLVSYLRGIYYVPDRTDVSTYSVPEVTWSLFRGQATLSYNLPRMLVGGSERVALSGPISADGTTATLTGPTATGTCTVAPSGMPVSCTERFTGITVDLVRVRDRALVEDPTRVDARVAVATRFSGDPIGVFESSEYIRAPAAATICTLDAECGASGRCDVELPPEAGFCEVHGATPIDGACTFHLDCAVDLECEVANGATTGVCAAHGGG